MGMVDAAPRIPWPLVRALAALDDRSVPIAEVWRRCCAVADTIGTVRPSYEQVRVLVHRERLLRAIPGHADLLADIVLRTRPPLVVLDELIERSLERRATRAAHDRDRRARPLS